MKTGAASFRTLLRRAKELRPAAEEYLSLLAALSDAIELSGGGGEPPWADDEEQEVKILLSDAKELL